MTNNDILRRIRDTFNLTDSKIIETFALAGHQVSQDQLSAWFKKNNEPHYQKCPDPELAIFLNGWIVDRRGKKEGPQPVADQHLTNNIIFTKMKIALNLQSTDILEIMDLAGLPMTKHDLSVFFRKPGHKHYRACKDEIFHAFLKGLQLKYSDNMPLKAERQ